AQGALPRVRRAPLGAGAALRRGHHRQLHGHPRGAARPRRRRALRDRRRAAARGRVAARPRGRRSARGARRRSARPLPPDRREGPSGHRVRPRLACYSLGGGMGPDLLDLELVVRRLAADAKARVSADAAAIWLLGLDGSELDLHAALGFARGSTARTLAHRPFGRLAEWLTTRRPPALAAVPASPAAGRALRDRARGHRPARARGLVERRGRARRPDRPRVRRHRRLAARAQRARRVGAEHRRDGHGHRRADRARRRERAARSPGRGARRRAGGAARRHGHADVDAGPADGARGRRRLRARAHRRPALRRLRAGRLAAARAARQPRRPRRRAAHAAAVRRADELGALLRAARTVMAGLDPRATLEQIVLDAAGIAGTPHVKVLVVDPTTRTLRVGALTGCPVPPDFSLALGTGYSGRVAVTGEPLFAADVADDPRNTLRERDRDAGMLTFLGLPIRSRDRVFGVLSFNTTTPRRYSPAELEYLGSFADLAGIALDNARLYDEAQQALADLKAVQQKLVQGETLR